MNFPTKALLVSLFSVLVAATPAAALTVNVVTDYGANGNDNADDSVAFQNAINAVVAAGGGTVFVPAGNFDFDSKKTMDLQSASVTIAGSGRGVTVLRGNNTSGIWYFGNSANDNQLTILDVTMLANIEGSAGIAIQIINPSLSSDPAIHSLYMERVVLERYVATNYWMNGIYTTNLQQPIFIDVIFANTNVADYTIPQHGFRINGTNAPYFENCFAKFVENGFDIANCKGAVILKNCVAVKVVRGFHVDAVATESCTVTMDSGHTNGDNVGAWIVDADNVQIKNIVAYGEGAAPYKDFYLYNCSAASITGCVFHFESGGTRHHVYLNAGTHDVVVKNNLYNVPSAIKVFQGSGVYNVTQTENLVAQ